MHNLDMYDEDENSNPPPQAAKKRSSARKSGAAAMSGAALVAAFDLHSAPGHLLRRCHSRARAIFDELIGKETGLSKQQVALMVTIAQKPAATHAQLSEETGFDRNTLADTIDRLIAKGLAVRARSRLDARAYEIGLTDDGHLLLRELIPRSAAVQAKIIEPIPEAQRATFIECLRMLAGVPDQELESIGPDSRGKSAMVDSPTTLSIRPPPRRTSTKRPGARQEITRKTKG